ncbi:hypothetical protein O988_09812 [Pseudogymnoascus sp. VKM F-3808]|nr:hypothetical protein O988_09812 [Pseudogymnoascus sp. VKM F-3808]
MVEGEEEEEGEEGKEGERKGEGGDNKEGSGSKTDAEREGDAVEEGQARGPGLLGESFASLEHSPEASTRTDAKRGSNGWMKLKQRPSPET